MAVIAPPSLQTPLGGQWIPGTVKCTTIIWGQTFNPNAGGLAYYPHQRSYEGDPLAAATSGLIVFRAMRPGNIINLYLWLGNLTGAGTSYYNVLKNGLPLFTGLNRFPVSSSDYAPSKTNLSIAVNRGDFISLDLETYASGQVHYGPISFLMETQ